MNHLLKNKKRMIKKRMINTAFLLIFSIIAVSTYFTANFSKAKDIVEISVDIKNAKQQEQEEKLVVNTTEGSNGDSFYIKLPKYVNNKKVIKYSYYIEEKVEEISTEENIDTDINNTESNIDEDINNVEQNVNTKEENSTDITNKEEVPIDEIGPNDVLPESKIYLTTSEVREKKLKILAHYDIKEVNEQILYNQLLSKEEKDSKITVTGYMPENALLDVKEVDKKEAQTTIREKTTQPVILSAAYDIKIQVEGKLYEPYEISQNLKVDITKESIKDKEVNIWHVKDDNQVEKLENEKIENTTSFETEGFSIFGLEDVEATALAIDGMADSVLTIDDATSDRNYWLGKNYTDDISGENSNTYTDANLSNVTINYYGYANNEIDPEKVGYVSLTERYNVLTYKKTVPIVGGNISVELIDNPFIDRPNGYGFGGWTSSDGTISSNSNTKLQTIVVTGLNNNTINVYANWTTATVVYVDGENGIDSNNGQTPDTAFGSWGAALNYLRNNSANTSDRENNIIVMKGNMDTSFNYTTPITASTYTGYDSTTTISSGIFILATGTGAGSNAITANGTTVTNTTLPNENPSDNVKWEISSISGSTYSIRNVATGQYLAYSNGLVMRDNSFTWTYSNRRFYYRSGWSSYYIRYNNGWTTTTSSGSAQQFYFVTYSIAGQPEKGATSTNNYYTSSTNVAFTLTSLYNHTDYRANAIMKLTNSSYNDVTIYNDFQMDYITIDSTGYTSNDDGTSFTTSYSYFLGRTNNVRIGRGMSFASNATESTTFTNLIGGSGSGTTGSTSNTNNEYRLVVESGKYSSIQGFNRYGNTSSYYGTVNFILGNDIDRIANNNNDLSVYYRTTVNSGGGVNGKSNIRDKSFFIIVKSGSFGIDYYNSYPNNDDAAYSGIYVGGYGTSASTSTRDISDRHILVEGGAIVNIIGGLKVTSGSGVQTRIYVKGGSVFNIVGGAGVSATYEDRIIQVTGGTIRYSVSGGSNGVYASSSSNNGKLNGNTLVYVGGNAQVGTDETINNTLYGVEAGCVLGAGNGNQSYSSSSGQVYTSHVIINNQAHILNSVYGGGNYGIIGTSGSTTGIAEVEILGGLVEKNVYGGPNNNNVYGKTIINVKDGQIKGAVYGGSNTTGTISTTSTVNITGGILGIESNTTDNSVLFGGGYGSSTTVTGNAIVNIFDTDKNVHIYGSGYGGSSLGRMSGNVTVNIQDIPTTTNKIFISGYMFAGGKGNATTAATISGTSTINVDGSDLAQCSVFGGNDINGTTSGIITVNIGKTYKSTLLSVYGGGNQADISTSAPGIYVYLLANANVTNAFNGGRAADLLSSGATNTTRAIYLQGGNATNIFGGSDSSGTVTASHVYIESGTVTNVYGGNNINGITTTSNVSITGGTVTNAYGGGYQAPTTASNVNLAGGTVKNGFGGGNAANVTNSSITLGGSTSENIYGGSNQQGTVTSSYVTINSGTVTNVFGGNNAGGNTIDTEVIVNGKVQNIYGGGNEAITTGNTEVTLRNATITGSAYGGGNGAAAVVIGDSLITAVGTTQIAQDLFGGGNAAATGTTENNSIVKVHITGGKISGDVYGAANTSVVNGQTQVKIGTTAVGDSNLAQGNIEIAGTVFGGGKSNTAGSDNYDFTFESVTGDVHIDINANGYDNGTNTFNIKGSIFGSGNAAKISGNGYIKISNYGTANSLKENISIQRATEVILDNCGMYLEGTTDRTNEISSALYTFNRINNLIIKNNTTIYLVNGANILEKLTSVDSSNNKATVTVGENGITSKNVDNRIYLLQGRNLILTTEAGNHGEVTGMTYVGLFSGTMTRETGIYDSSYNDGDTVPEDTIDFERNSYVQGKHYDSHDITADGFYTNYNNEGKIDVQYINPTPENAIYYQWILGEITDDIFYGPIELIATKYATTSTYVLSLDGLSFPNTTLEVVGLNTSELDHDVSFVDQNEIPNIEMDVNKANKRFGLTMTTGNTGWQTKGTSEFFTTDNDAVGSFGGATQFLSDNSTTTPTFSFYMANSKNISVNENLGTVTIQLQAKYIENEEMVIRNVFIDLTISTNNTFKLANDYYEGAMTPGKEYTMFPTTNTSITSNSSLSSYYSLYLGNYSTDEEYYDEFVGYYHCLITSCVFPAKTKITMIDRSGSTIKYYYYIVTEEDEANARKEFKFTEFTAMGSTNEKYNSDQSYYNRAMDIVLEEFIFQVDFADITLTNTFENQTLIVQLRDLWDDSMKLTVNTDQYPMLFNLYSDKEAIKSVNAKPSKTYIYMGDNFKIDLTTAYEFQTQNAEVIYDTTHFEDQLGVKITVLEGSTPLTASELTGIYVEYNGKRYYARYDGSYRMKIADAVSNVLTDMIFYTENGQLDTATYTFRFETFGSIDGVYFSSAIATDNINMQIINTDYGLSAELDDNSVLIDKVTGMTKNNNNALDFIIGYQAEFANPKINVSLYRRDYTNIYASTYSLVDLKEYVSNTLITTAKEKEYLVTDTVQSTQNFTLRLKENIITGTYKVVFSLYDGDNYIGNVEKMIIIK